MTTVAESVAAMIPRMQERAATLDRVAAFPAEDIADLHEIGALPLPLPIEGTGASDRLADVLMRIGMGNLAVGRVVEAHFNARHLIARYGTVEQRARAADDVCSGQLFALWVTPEHSLRMICVGDGFRLEGEKQFCSAAGRATRALVTAVDEGNEARMLMVALGNGERVRALASPLQGMRAAITGAVDFTGCMVSRDACLGEAGDYLREPDFSAGAWRSSAVAAGGLRSLVHMMQHQLHAAGRIDNPHQLQRLGCALIAAEASELWVRQAARIAEDPTADPAETVAYVGLARIAVEKACLDAMQLAQRSLGLSAFRQGNPVERICRDLATYLRQPAPDEVLTGAAAHFAAVALRP